MLAERTAVLPQALPYRPGQFYLRELPPLRAVLADLSGLGLLVVDGYADLDPGGRPGPGAHAHAEFGIPVIGVAKSRFRTATHAVAVLRGSSLRPLFVTAAGMPRADAADLVRRMTGRYRLPDAAPRRHPRPSRTTRSTMTDDSSTDLLERSICGLCGHCLRPDGPYIHTGRPARHRTGTEISGSAWPAFW